MKKNNSMVNTNNDNDTRTRARAIRLAWVLPPLLTAALAYAEARSQYERAYEDLNDLIYLDVPDRVTVAVNDILDKYPQLTNENDFPQYSKTTSREFLGLVPKTNIEYFASPIPIEGTPLSITAIFSNFGGYGYELESSPNSKTDEKCRFTFKTDAFLKYFYNTDSWLTSPYCYDEP